MSGNVAIAVANLDMETTSSVSILAQLPFS